MEKNFEIGQVVYILSEQAQTILPGIIAEEVSVKKLSGNSISWKIKVGGADKAKLFDSAKIKGEVYGSLDDVKAVMSQRLNEYISKMVVDAELRVEKWYGKEVSERQKQEYGVANLSVSSVDDRIDPDLLLSSIENAPVVPKFTPEAPRVVQSHNPQETLRNKLTALAIPPEDEDQQENGEGAIFITGPNGEKIPVRMSKTKV